MGSPILGFALAIFAVGLGHQLFRWSRINLSFFNDYSYMNRRNEF